MTTSQFNSDEGTTKLWKRLIRYEEHNIFIYTLFSGIGSLLTAVYLEATFKGDPFLIGLSHLVRDIGIALLVGAYLSVTVERLNTLKSQREVERYIRIVGDNFLLAVYGKKHPLELFDVIKASIVDQPFIRNFFNVEVHVHDFTDNYIEAAPHNVKEMLKSFKASCSDNPARCKDLVVLKESTHYDMQNVSANAHQCPITYAIEKPFGGAHEGLCGITSLVINREEQIRENVYHGSSDGSSTTMSYRTMVKLEPGESARVDIEAYTLRSNDDSELWGVVVPSKGLTLSVTDGDGNKNIYLSVNAPLIRDYDKYDKHATKNPKTNKAHLEIDQYLLPYQGIMVKWTPTDQSS